MDHQKSFKTLVSKKTGLYCNLMSEHNELTYTESSYPELWGKYVYLEDIINYLNRKYPNNQINWDTIRENVELVDVDLSFSLN